MTSASRASRAWRRTSRALLAAGLLGGGVLQVAVPVELGDAGARHLAQVPPAVLEVSIPLLQCFESKHKGQATEHLSRLKHVPKSSPTSMCKYNCLNNPKALYSSINNTSIP